MLMGERHGGLIGDRIKYGFRLFSREGVDQEKGFYVICLCLFFICFYSVFDRRFGTKERWKYLNLKDGARIGFAIHGSEITHSGVGLLEVK